LLDPGAFGEVEPAGDVVGRRVEVLLGHAGAEADLDQPRLEIHRDGSAVLHRTGEVVNVDVVAKNGLRVPIRERDRGAGERNQRGVWQRVA